jgi:hypothetical protein
MIGLEELPERSGVYSIENVKTGQAYVGASSRMRTRCRVHWSQLRSGNAIAKLQAAAELNGLGSFKVTVLEECPPDLIPERELHWIKKLSPDFNTHKEVFMGHVAGPSRSTVVSASIDNELLAVVEQYRAELPVRVTRNAAINEALREWAAKRARKGGKK